MTTTKTARPLKPGGRAWERERAAFLAARDARREEAARDDAARYAAARERWDSLPTSARIGEAPPTPLDGWPTSVTTGQRCYPLPESETWENGNAHGMPEPYRTTVLPGLGTDDEDAAIGERFDVVAESETVADGSVSVSVSVRLWTGSATWGTADGSATGPLDDYRRVRRTARRAAERAARDARADGRSRTAVLGSDAPVSVPADDAPVCPVSGDDYRTLRAYVSRRVYGNAADGSRSPYVVAGVAALGIPATPETVEDGTAAAVAVVCRWAVEGLPESLAETVAEWREAGRDVRPLLLGSAARDGLRAVTGAARPTSLAAATARYRARLGQDPRRSVDAPTSDRGNVVGNAAPVSVGRTSYVMVPTAPDRVSDVILSRPVGPDGRPGRLRFPTLAALLLLDSGEERGTGGTAAAARLLKGSTSGAARRAVKAAAVAEWREAVGLLRPETSDDAADVVRAGAVTVVR